MRLLNSTTLKMEDFFGDQIPPYGILSHCWEREEVTFQEMKGSATARFKAGYKKIKRCAQEVKKSGLDWLWVDTCCIDKSSSAELSESINSMYQWYQAAVKCYVFLPDVISSGSRDQTIKQLQNSRWWSRGWTLQELIAPSHVDFYTTEWNYIDNKVELVDLISAVTTISKEVLLSGDPSTSSVAQIMSWASKRQTTRVEDRAYCLLGLFEVNMPMLYGEGNGAFTRLQEEIMKKTHDHSLFAWKYPETIVRQDSYFLGLLAPSPSYFMGCDKIKSSSTRKTPYSMTNLGLYIQLTLMALPGEEGLYVAKLGCFSQPQHFLGVRLKRLEDNIFARVDPSIDQVWGHTGDTYIQDYYYIPQKILQPPLNAFHRAFGLWFSDVPSFGKNHEFQVWPREMWVFEKHTLQFPDRHLEAHSNAPIGAIIYRPLGDPRNIPQTDSTRNLSVAVIFGFGQPPSGPSFGINDQGPRLWVCVMPNRWTSWEDLRSHYHEDLIILEREDPGAVLPRQIRYFPEWATRRFAVPSQEIERQRQYFEFKWNMQLRGDRLVMKVAMGIGKELDPALNRSFTVDPSFNNRFSRVMSY